MGYEDKYQEFEQYLLSSEPDKVPRAKNWSIAIGLQQVDGLTPSDFLVSQAKENIEGKISPNIHGSFAMLWLGLNMKTSPTGFTAHLSHLNAL